MKKSFHRPTIVVSACLGLANCRWDGDCVEESFVNRLRKHARIIPVCPEVEIGLGIPRDPIRLVSDKVNISLLQPSTGRRLTRKMKAFSKDFLTNLGDVDGFILKHKSPSCGVRKVKLFESSSAKAIFKRTGRGLFAEGVIASGSDFLVEDEVRLKSVERQETFLTRIFATASLRSTLKKDSLRQLRLFHNKYESLLRIRSPQVSRKLSALLDAGEDKEFSTISKEYQRMFINAISKSIIRSIVIEHLKLMVEHFEEDITPEESNRFSSLLESYRNRQVFLSDICNQLRVFGVRYDRDFIRRQAFFQPFPDGLTGNK